LAQAVQHFKGSSEEEKIGPNNLSPVEGSSSLIGWDSTWGGLWKSMGKFVNFRMRGRKADSSRQKKGARNDNRVFGSRVFGSE
jgi:hypothetical protein